MRMTLRELRVLLREGSESDVPVELRPLLDDMEDVTTSGQRKVGTLSFHAMKPVGVTFTIRRALKGGNDVLVSYVYDTKKSMTGMPPILVRDVSLVEVVPRIRRFLDNWVKRNTRVDFGAGTVWQVKGFSSRVYEEPGGRPMFMEPGDTLVVMDDPMKDLNPGWIPVEWNGNPAWVSEKQLDKKRFKRIVRAPKQHKVNTYSILISWRAPEVDRGALMSLMMKQQGFVRERVSNNDAYDLVQIDVQNTFESVKQRATQLSDMIVDEGGSEPNVSINAPVNDGMIAFLRSDKTWWTFEG